MSNYSLVRLLDVAKNPLEYGSGASAASYDGKTRYIRITDINENGSLSNSRVSPSEVDEKYLLREGDILFARSGATVGKTYIHTDNDSRCIYAGYLIRLTSNTEMVIPKYVFYYTRSSKYGAFIKYSQRAVAQPNINARQYSEMLIPIYELKDQQLIVDNMDKAQEIIDGHKKQLEELDNLIRAIFYDMFGDPITNEKGWDKTELKNILLDIRYGTSIPPAFSAEGYKFIRATNIKKGRIIEDDMKFISEDEAQKIDKCRLSENEMIIVRSGVNSGDTCVITENYTGHFAGYDLILKFDLERALPHFLNELFNTNYLENVIKPLTRRAAQPHINSEQVQSLQAILPPIELQKKYVSVIHTIETQKSLVKQSITDSQNLFNSLMSRYFD